MSNRYIKIQENSRALTRGVAEVSRDNFSFTAANDDALPFTIDWTPFLAGDTIESVANTTTGPVITSESNTSSVASMTLSGDAGVVTHQITTTAGTKKTIYISANSGSREIDPSGYYQ